MWLHSDLLQNVMSSSLAPTPLFQQVFYKNWAPNIQAEPPW